MGYSLAPRIKAVPLWVGMKSNPADHPSRFAPLPPAAPALAWVEQAWKRDPPALPAPAPCTTAGRTSQTRGLLSTGTGACRGTGANVATRAARLAPLFEPPPGLPPPELQKRTSRSRRTLHCKEYFSGVGGLTKAWAACESLTSSQQPLEAYGPSGYNPSQDLTKHSVLRIDLDAIERSALLGAHLGTPCTFFCRMFQT